MEINASCIKNVEVADPGIDSLCSDGNNITSTHTADLISPTSHQQHKDAKFFSPSIRVVTFTWTILRCRLRSLDGRIPYDIYVQSRNRLNRNGGKGGLWYEQAPDAPHINYLF